MMNPQKAKRLFIIYQSLYVKYQEAADSYRRQVKKDVRVYSDGLAALALSKANEYEMIARGAR